MIGGDVDNTKYNIFVIFIVKNLRDYSKESTREMSSEWSLKKSEFSLIFIKYDNNYD